ncbi:MAG: tetratricopeptide repeat protein [Pirellulales bacterium]|nr:tetratricopeptide repeat protein [Pirellulales bacterium]
MTRWTLRIFGTVLLLSVSAASAAYADDPGQESLDKAIEKKISASNIAELGEVIDLAQQAIDQGLEKDNLEFAHQLLTSCLLQRATAIFQTAIKGAQNDPRWIQQLPKIRELALADLERLLAIDPKQSEAQYLVGRLQALPGGDRAKGLAALDQAEQLTEDPADKAKILTTRATLQETPEKQLADLDAALAIDGQLVDALQRRGRVLLELGQAEKALADFDAVLAEQPDEAGILEAKGIALLALNRVDDAMAVFDRALEIEPRMFATYLHRARVQMSRGNLEQAVDELDKSLLINNGNAAAYLLRATCLQMLGKHEQAAKDIDRLLQVQPGNVGGLRFRAGMLANAGKIDESLNILEEIARQLPDDVEVRLQQASILRTASRVQDAIDVLTQVLEKQPKLALALHTRADALLSLGRQEEALADYRAAVEIDGQNPTLLNNLAWVLATSPNDALRDGKKSIELATKACELTEFKKAFILSTLAAAYAEAGDFENAKKYVQQALDTGDEDLKDEISKEQANYLEGKPWRETQSVEDQSHDKTPAEEAPATTSAETTTAEGKSPESPPAGDTAPSDGQSLDAPGKDEQPKSAEPDR